VRWTWRCLLWCDLYTEVASGWIEKSGGLFDEDVMVTGMCFMIKTLL
jgi:hypothetical protein